MATMYTANHLGVRAIASLTETGSTALWMSRISSGIPIYALSRHESTNRKVNLYRGVFPIYFPTIHTNHAEANQEAVDLMTIQAVESKHLNITAVILNQVEDSVENEMNNIEDLKRYCAYPVFRCLYNQHLSPVFTSA